MKTNNIYEAGAFIMTDLEDKFLARIELAKCTVDQLLNIVQVIQWECESNRHACPVCGHGKN